MGDPAKDYFVAGVHEALITELSKIGALTVISRTSAMRYRNTNKSVPEIARELGVDAVVEGSVFRAGNTVRITAQLLEAATDELNQHRRQAVIWVEQIKAAQGVLLRIATDRSRDEASGKERQVSIDALTRQMEKLLPGTQKQRDTLAAKHSNEARAF